MSYQKEYRESIENPEAFWSRQAELINWYEKPKSILSQDEKGFYQAKIATAHFFMERVLPQTGSLFSAIMVGGKTMMEFPDDAF